MISFNVPGDESRGSIVPPAKALAMHGRPLKRYFVRKKTTIRFSIVLVCLASLFCGIISGCYWTSGSDPVHGEYSIAWHDGQGTRELRYRQHQVVPSCVFAAGISGDHLVVLRHPLTAAGAVDTDSTLYYLLPLDPPPGDTLPAVLGPLSLAVFDSLVAGLPLPQPEFRRYPLYLQRRKW